jgi:fatty-acyl-CoA synthase
MNEAGRTDREVPSAHFAHLGRTFNWVDQVLLWGRRTPMAVALVDGLTGQQRTYGDLDARSDRLAGALVSRGVGAGDRVVILMDNRLEFVESLLAVNRLGAIGVPVNFRLVADEVAYIVDQSGSSALIVGDGQASLVAGVRAGAAHPCLVVGDDARCDAAGPGAEPYEAALWTDANSERIHLDDHSPALLMYTSGTTGRPKGAILSYSNLGVQAMALARLWGLEDEVEVNLIGSPLFHIGALASVLPILSFGGTNVIMPSGAFDASSTVFAMERHGVTCCFLVPVQWQAICDLPDAATSLALRVVAWGAAPATRQLLLAMTETFSRARIVATFGQTEMGPITCALRWPHPIEKLGSVGKPLSIVDIRIIDAEMRDVPVGDVGEIVYRGPSVMLGYWRDEAATADAFSGGWFHSGDLVRQDDEGYIYVVDRLKDMIISGGENIYCAELESAIASDPRVSEVAVIGVPDDRWGETPVAVVTARDPSDPPREEDVMMICRSRLASYKKPSRLVIMDELPRSAAGKVLKGQLRAFVGSYESKEGKGEG